MSSDPILDLIIGESKITRNNFSFNRATSSCAFPSGGFLSIISQKENERNNIIVSKRPISAISFSRTGNSIAVGESGPSSSVFIFNFKGDKYDEIESKIVVRTQEKGFTCLALDYENGKLITVGKSDSHPYFLLWDLKEQPPVIIGHYTLPVVPTHISMNENIALVSGNEMLKIIHLTVNYKGSPQLLNTTNANVGSYKNSKFVSVDCQSDICYALTSKGTICSFNIRSISKQIKLRAFNTNRSNTTSMSVDDKLIVCGTTKGSILGIKRPSPLHLFGDFYTPKKSVVAVGVLKNTLVAAYADGCIWFWRRRLNTPPQLTFTSPVGPICALRLIHEDSVLISVGNDGFIRAWDIESNSEKSSQSLIGESRLESYKSNLNDISGIRCITSTNNDQDLFAGDDYGSLFKIKSINLEKVKQIKTSGKSIHCIASHPSLNLIAVGNSEGNLSIYNTSLNNVKLSILIKLSDSPITHITFTETKIICSSLGDLYFCNLPDMKCSVASKYNGSSLFMSLSYAKQAQLVFAACEDMNLHAFDINTGKIFRTYKLSYSDFPIKAIVHQSGIIIAVAMSNGHILILDTMSGSIVLSFQTYALNITDIIFHQDDIIVSTFNGCMLRWCLPDTIHKILNGENNGQESETPPSSNGLASSSIFRSMFGSNNPQPQWAFNEVPDNSPQQDEEEVQGDVFEDQNNLNKPNLDDYKKQNEEKNAVDEEEEQNEIKDILRRSFYAKKDMKSLNEGKKLLSMTPVHDDDDEEDDDSDDKDENQNKPNPSTPIKKSDEINELSKQISDLMTKVNSFLEMNLSDQKEIDAQNQLKEVASQLNPVNKDFEDNYSRLNDYANQLLNYAKQLQELTQKTKECSVDLSKTIDTI